MNKFKRAAVRTLNVIIEASGGVGMVVQQVECRFVSEIFELYQNRTTCTFPKHVQPIVRLSIFRLLKIIKRKIVQRDRTAARTAVLTICILTCIKKLLDQLVEKRPSFPVAFQSLVRRIRM